MPASVFTCSEFTTFQLLHVADYIVTDYSGLSLEASMLSKPVYIYAYDYEEYSQDPGLNVDLEKELKPYFFKDVKEVSKKLKQAYKMEILLNYQKKYIKEKKDVTDKLVNIIIKKGGLE